MTGPLVLHTRKRIKASTFFLSKVSAKRKNENHKKLVLVESLYDNA